MTPQQLFAWQHEAKQGRPALPADAISFVPVVAAWDENGPTTPTATTSDLIEVDLGGVVVKLRATMPPTGLTKFLRAVKAAL